MAVLTPWPLPQSFPLQSVNCRSNSRGRLCGNGGRRWCTVASQQQQLCTEFDRVRIDKSALTIEEAFSDDELWATSLLRVRSFYDFKQSFGIEDHKKYLAQREFEALKERLAGTKEGQKVSCINATLPFSQARSFPDELASSCKFSLNGEDRIVVGTLDLNQCMSLPNEITGLKPKGIGGDFARAYLSNVCVAKECQRNGLGFALIDKSKSVAEDWGKVSYASAPPAPPPPTHSTMWTLPVGLTFLLQHIWASRILSSVSLCDTPSHRQGLHPLDWSGCFGDLSGISDLYVHVAVDNEPAKNLYTKSGFTYESEEPAWQARFLDRPRRLLLWIGLPNLYDR